MRCQNQQSFFLQEIIAYIHLHPQRIIALLALIFAVLITCFFILKKGVKKWITLGLLIIFVPLAFRIVKMTPIKKLSMFSEAPSTDENTELSSYDKNGVKTFGLDISHHQGTIDWDSVAASKHPIQFVIMRATYGSRKLDDQFHRNWEESNGKNLVRGIYHYYRPHQSSTSQFAFFKSHVYLRKGDLPPVIDVEENSLFGRENLIKGVKNWLKLAEEHYHVKPIIYTNLSFYKTYFDRKDFKPYHFWIAAYSGRDRISNVPWTFFQFTEKVKVKGITANVDGNDFNGDRIALEKLTIR